MFRTMGGILRAPPMLMGTEFYVAIDNLELTDLEVQFEALQISQKAWRQSLGLLKIWDHVA